MDGPPENDVCSICHGSFHVPCQANCSHWFCAMEIATLHHNYRVYALKFYLGVLLLASCILQVWDHGSALQACKCPLCRRPITLLVPSESASRLHRDPEVPEVLRRVEQYNCRFGQHANGLLQRMQDLPFLLRRLLRDMTDPQRSLPFVIRARVYLAVFLSGIYVLSPVDLIPEGFLGIIGLLDDLIIMFICFLHVAALYRSVLLFRHGGS